MIERVRKKEIDGHRGEVQRERGSIKVGQGEFISASLYIEPIILLKKSDMKVQKSVFFVLFMKKVSYRICLHTFLFPFCYFVI